MQAQCIRKGCSGIGNPNANEHQRIYLEIAPGRTLCADCCMYSNEGLIGEDSASVKCCVCLNMTAVGEEYVQNADGEIVCDKCLNKISEKLDELFQNDEFNPPVQETEDFPECAMCHVKQIPDGKPLLRCSACKVTLYCCTSHQKDHWPEHKATCKKLRKENP